LAARIVELDALGNPTLAFLASGAEGLKVRITAKADTDADADAILAAEEAVLRGWDLRVVHGCWEPGAVAESDLALFHDRELLVKTRGAELDGVVEPLRRRHPGLRIEASPLLESPFDALRDAAADAGLVVLGDRGTGFAPLGATATAMLRRAACTVAIVPGPRSREVRTLASDRRVPARQG
jgi:nucleotide-binding universal stress UspA family protein